MRVLVASGAEGARNGVRLGDVDIDVIGVGSYDVADLDGLTELDRAFVLGQRWALDTAEPVRLVLTDGSSEVLAVSTRLATPAALVATKLQSTPRRRGATITKRASDLYDIYRLLVRHNQDGDIARDLATAPDGLGRWCRSQTERLFIVEADRSRRWLATEGSPAMAQVSVEALRAAGSLLVADLGQIR